MREVKFDESPEENKTTQPSRDAVPIKSIREALQEAENMRDRLAQLNQRLLLLDELMKERKGEVGLVQMATEAEAIRKEIEQIQKQLETLPAHPVSPDEFYKRAFSKAYAAVDEYQNVLDAFSKTLFNSPTSFLESGCSRLVKLEKMARLWLSVFEPTIYSMNPKIMRGILDSIRNRFSPHETVKRLEAEKNRMIEEILAQPPSGATDSMMLHLVSLWKYEAVVQVVNEINELLPELAELVKGVYVWLALSENEEPTGT